MKIIMAHGSGGAATSDLIEEVFISEFGTQNATALEDCAVVEGAGRIAMTTDSFVVTPLKYPGGDIGRLAVCGTVNDLLMRGAIPKYITCGFILQEGTEVDLLNEIVHSLAETAREAGVQIVAGDTKVIEGNGGILINTAGVGFVPEDRDISSTRIRPGDAVLLSGNLGDHHATILGCRMNIQNEIQSDNAPLNEMVGNLFKENLSVHTMRDVTRGGLGTVMKELADSSRVKITLEEEKLPVSPAVQNFCGLLGLDPLYMGNEGKMVCFLPKEESEKALLAIKNSRYGSEATVIGYVESLSENEGENSGSMETKSSCGEVFVKTSIGGLRRLDILQGEGLPRIC
ncbi:MAG: hydrogenase expression/formation protein HypE [Lachnospiraceae bacterium]|nr:hydrogenase expression/formation protein HypE [Lachnospiraceae bacterium]